MKKPLPEAERQRINKAMCAWRQGDIVLGDDLEAVHMADLSLAHSPQSLAVVEELLEQGREAEPGAVPVLDATVHGMVMLSHSCEIVRDCIARPSVEVAPLVRVRKEWMREIRLRRRLRYIFVPATEGALLVGDLERSMSEEKAVVAGWKRTPGWSTDEQAKSFADTLAFKVSRDALPDDFLHACSEMRYHIFSEHNADTTEGNLLRELEEIRVLPDPSWDSGHVELDWWFVVEDSAVVNEDTWMPYLNKWLEMFVRTGRYRVRDKFPCGFTDFSAAVYRKSYRLDFDRLSYPEGPEGADGMAPQDAPPMVHHP